MCDYGTKNKNKNDMPLFRSYSHSYPKDGRRKTNAA